MKILLVAIFVAFSLTFVRMQSSDLEEDYDRASSICHKPGYLCKNCYESIQCIQNGENFTEIPAEICNGPYTCFNGTCTLDPNPGCNSTGPGPEPEPDFICQTPGMYPDPFSCTTFHYCIKNDHSWDDNDTLLHFTDKCSCNHSYNMLTTFCDIPIVNGTCEDDYPLVRCNYVGQTGSFSMNPSLYYICRQHPYKNNIYPFTYACENGKLYNSENYLCN
ncbi:hypothetical protein FQR65_LT11178 [Abscondita terminalis]|nr:hypothetical protein FQR65_LT11178 [Abscondita terminalis]